MSNQTTNQDPHELDAFNALAANWWDTTGPMWALHAINPLRINLVNDQMDVDTARILDIGCGGGIASEALAQRGAQVTGIDLAANVIDIAKKHAAEAQLDITYEQIAAETLAEREPQTFDLVCCFELLEHLPNPAELVKACARLVKPNGLVIFSTINRTPKAFVQAIVAAEYLLDLVPKGTHSYAKFIRPSELFAWAEESGLQPITAKGMGYNPLTKKFKLNRDLSVNYFLITRLL